MTKNGPKITLQRKIGPYKYGLLQRARNFADPQKRPFARSIGSPSAGQFGGQFGGQFCASVTLIEKKSVRQAASQTTVGQCFSGWATTGQPGGQRLGN
jgi:hypothetical protein